MILTWNLDQLLNLTRKMRQRQKNFDCDAMSANVRLLYFIQFMANLQPPRSRIPDKKSIKRKCQIRAIYYLPKTENRTKKSLTQLLYNCFK